MTSFNWNNAIVAVPISLLIGTGLGIAQGWLASVLGTPAPRRLGPFAAMAHPSQMAIV